MQVSFLVACLSLSLPWILGASGNAPKTTIDPKLLQPVTSQSLSQAASAPAPPLLNKRSTAIDVAHRLNACDLPSIEQYLSEHVFPSASTYEGACKVVFDAVDKFESKSRIPIVKRALGRILGNAPPLAQVPRTFLCLAHPNRVPKDNHSINQEECELFEEFLKGVRSTKGKHLGLPASQVVTGLLKSMAKVTCRITSCQAAKFKVRGIMELAASFFPITIDSCIDEFVQTRDYFEHVESFLSLGPRHTNAHEVAQVIKAWGSKNVRIDAALAASTWMTVPFVVYMYILVGDNLWISKNTYAVPETRRLLHMANPMANWYHDTLQEGNLDREGIINLARQLGYVHIMNALQKNFVPIPVPPKRLIRSRPVRIDTLPRPPRREPRE